MARFSGSSGSGIPANISESELLTLDGVVSAIQTQIDGKQAVVANVSNTEIGYLDGVTSAIQTQLNDKLSTSTASSTYQPIVSGVDNTEIGYLNGVTSSIQTQLDAKIAKALTSTTGDIIYASSANTPARLGIGSTDQVLKVSGGVPVWGSAPASTPTFVGCSAGGTTTLTNGATTFVLAMNTENFDTDGFHDNATNNTRFTIPTGKGGKYQINIRVGLDNASGVPGGHNIHVRVNGTTGAFSYTSTSTILTNATDNTNTISVGSGILSLAAGDYIEVLARTDNGYGTVSATLVLSIAYLGA